MEAIAEFLEEQLLLFLQDVENEPDGGEVSKPLEIEQLLLLARLRGSVLALPDLLSTALHRQLDCHLQHFSTSKRSVDLLRGELQSLGFDVSACSNAAKSVCSEVLQFSCSEGADLSFSASSLWASSRSFYESAGASAWFGNDAVPSEATCNSFVAACLAKAALAFRNDVCASQGITHQLVIVDVGAGHAALTYLIATAVRMEPDLVGRVIVLATDFSEDLLRASKALPCFQSFLLDLHDPGQQIGVEFAVLDLGGKLQSSAYIKLLHSEMSLQDLLGTQPACFFHVCCYIFDSIPTDIHYLRKTSSGILEASEIRVTVDDSAMTCTPWLGSAAPLMSESSRTVMQEYGDELKPGQSVCRCVPKAGAVALQQLFALGGQYSPCAVAVVDEPYDLDDDTYFQKLPEISPNSCAFALAVDFDALWSTFSSLAPNPATHRWRSQNALEGLTLQVMACASEATYYQLEASLQRGPLGCFGFYDYLLLLSAARRRANREFPRSQDSLSRDFEILEYLGHDRILQEALAHSSAGGAGDCGLVNHAGSFPQLMQRLLPT